MDTIGALGSLLGNLQEGGGENKKSSKEGEDDINILETIGNVVGSLQNAGGKKGGGIDAGTLLQGLGGLLGGGQNGEGGFDPSMLGSLVNMFTQSQEAENVKTTGPVNQPKTSKKGKNNKKKKASDESFDFGQLLSIAQNFIGNQNGKGTEAIIYKQLPVILKVSVAYFI